MMIYESRGNHPPKDMAFWGAFEDSNHQNTTIFVINRPIVRPGGIWKNISSKASGSTISTKLHFIGNSGIKAIG